MNKNINLKALFLGSKGENAELFKTTLIKLINDHVGWRQNYIPRDPNLITASDKNEDSFKVTSNLVAETLDELSVKLRTDSLPWHTAGRFWGHMNSETLMPSILAYSFALLWNGNNVAYESSPATSKMEEEVGLQFATLYGFKHGWGHIAADGSIANAEGLWYARNIKSIPLAIKKVDPETVKNKSDWELLNFSTEQILDMMGKLIDKIDQIKNYSARSSMDLSKLGKWIVPQTKHYSWLKAADILGIGLDQVIACDVTHEYRMDVNKLEKIILELAAKKIPILGVVGVIGSTEEGQIDRIDEIVKLRNKLFATKHIYFYIHVDAAYGGYTRSLFLNEKNEFMSYLEMQKTIKSAHIFYGNPKWLTPEIYESFKAASEVESITIDPHKMGYIPYSAGGVIIKEMRMRDVISYFAAYVFEKNANIPALLGAYILEGSKAGATAAAVWVANKILPLNIYGYGRLIGASIESAYNFYQFIHHKEFKLSNGKIIELTAITKPDFNMVDYVFNEKGNKDLAKMNKLNHDFYEYASYVKGGTYENEYITSHSDFAIPEYGNSPLTFVKSLGFSEEEWIKVGKISILRAAVMTPYMNEPKAFEYFAKEIEKAMKQKLESIYEYEVGK